MTFLIVFIWDYYGLSDGFVDKVISPLVSVFISDNKRNPGRVYIYIYVLTEHYLNNLQLKGLSSVVVIFTVAQCIQQKDWKGEAIKYNFVRLIKYWYQLQSTRQMEKYGWVLLCGKRLVWGSSPQYLPIDDGNFVWNIF